MNNDTRGPAFGRSAGRQLPFSEAIAGIAEVPAPFQAPLVETLNGHADTVRQIIHTPAFSSYTYASLANLLVLTDEAWLLLVDTPSAIEVQSAPFAATRLLELYGVLLQGRFSIEYGAAAAGQFALQFNMVSADLFRDALFHMLEKAQASAPLAPAPTSARLAAAEGLPFKFLSTLDELVPAEETLLSITSWPAQTRSSFSRTRVEVPAGFIAVFDNWVCVVTEASAEESEKNNAFSGYGKVATYLNRRFPFAWKSTESGNAADFVIWVGTGSQVSELEVRVPAEHAIIVEEVLAVLDAGRND